MKQKLLQKTISKYLKSTYKSNTGFKDFLLQKGISNYRIIPEFLQRLWPYWVTKQQDSTNEGFGLDTNYLSLINNRYRNWTFISDAFVDDHVMVDPAGLIHIDGKPFSIDFWIGNSNKLFSPSHKDAIEQTFDPLSGSLTSTFSLSQVAVSSEVFFRKLPSQYNLAFCNYSLTNTSDKPVKLSFYIVIRPYDLEGVTTTSTIQYLQSKAFLVNHEMAVIFDKKPDNIVCSTHQEGDVSEHFNKLEMIFQSQCEADQASAFAEYNVVLGPQESTSFSLKCPCLHKSFKPSLLNTSSHIRIESFINDLNPFSFDKEKSHNEFQLKQFHDTLATMNIPNNKLSNFINAQKTQLLHSVGASSFQKGHYASYLYGPLDDLVLFKSLCQLGYNPDLFSSHFSVSYFQQMVQIVRSKQMNLTTLGTWFTTLKELYYFNAIKLSADSQKILQKILLTALKSQVTYEASKTLIASQRCCNRTGLNSFYLSDNLGLMESLKAFQYISQRLNLPNAVDIAFYEHQLKHRIESFCESVSTKVAMQHIIPVNMFQYISLDSIITLHKYIRFFPNDQDRIHNTLSLIQSQFIKNHCIYSTVNPTGYSIKETLLYIQALCRLGNPDSFMILESLLERVSPTHAFPDVIHPITDGGSDGDGHNLKLSAMLIDTFIQHVVTEQDTHLELFSLLPASWLIEHSFSFSSIITSFGPLSLDVRQTENETHLAFNLKQTSKLDYFIVVVPDTFTSVKLRNEYMPITSHRLKVPKSISSIVLRNDNAPQTQPTT